VGGPPASNRAGAGAFSAGVEGKVLQGLSEETELRTAREKYSESWNLDGLGSEPARSRRRCRDSFASIRASKSLAVRADGSKRFGFLPAPENGTNAHDGRPALTQAR